MILYRYNKNGMTGLANDSKPGHFFMTDSG